MKSPINELLINFINTRSKVFIDYDYIIFFHKDAIIKNITKSYFPMNRFKKLKEAEKKLKKRKIYFYYYSYNQLELISNKIKFNDGRPKFNELYFKLKDYNEEITRYYTYEDFIIFSENYNYNFFVFLFSYFGLKSIRWSYSNSNENNTIVDNNANIGIQDHKNEFQYSTDETSKTFYGIEGCKNFENIGSINYFNCCDRRAHWYNYPKKNINIVVKELLNLSDRYFYEYYKNNESLQIRLENRLRGAKKICYEITNNTHHKIIINKMIKISNKFSKFGIKLNTSDINTRNYKKKYNITFWDIEDLELITVEDLINNKNLIHNINFDFNKIDDRFNILYNKDIKNLDKQLELLQCKIKEQKLKSFQYLDNFDN
jgi:hypothetical protein